jgi:hypothetical protein
MTAFPTDDYTPLGYLDNRDHTWVLRPSGVVCARVPLSLAWYWPWQVAPRYIAEVRLAFEAGTGHLKSWQEGVPAGRILRCPYHSKNVLVAEVEGPIGYVTFEAFVGGRDLLCWRGRLRSCGCTAQTRLVAAARLWSPRKAVGPWQGGIAAMWDPSERSGVLRHYAEGVVLRVTSDPGPDRGAVAATPEELLDRLASPSSSVRSSDHARTTEEMWVAISLPLQESGEFWIKFSRGRSRESAVQAGSLKPRALRAVRSNLMSEDRAFWATAPKLEGDWPSVWKRGWVYDWETLRMCVRDPVGKYHGPWDAMQIQMPRVVIAETMLDMLMMSYAAPELARSVILGTFRDAISPQVPCSREDGSVNMVAVDGSECGTSPSWCFPFHCLLSINLRAGSQRWLRRLYPYLQEYLRWWRANRTDEAGFAVYKCSWESGQDCSPRFGVPQPTGGELVDHARAVDLQAGLAFSGRVMAFLAAQLGRDGSEWMSMAAHFERDGTLYRDYDRRTGRPVMPETYKDLTFLAPLMCISPDPGRTASMAHELDYFLENPAGWLEWPSFFFQFCECAWAAGRGDLLSRAVAETAHRIYRHWDKREATEGLPLPGLAVENWLPGGMEGYGWGATLPVAIIRCLLGIRVRWEQDLVVEVRPNLSEDLLSPGSVYRIGPLAFRDVVCSVACEVARDGAVRVVLDRVDDQSDRFIARTVSEGFESEAPWGPGQPVAVSLARGDALILRRPLPR